MEKLAPNAAYFRVSPTELGLVHVQHALPLDLVSRPFLKHNRKSTPIVPKAEIDVTRPG